MVVTESYCRLGAIVSRRNVVTTEGHPKILDRRGESWSSQRVVSFRKSHSSRGGSQVVTRHHFHRGRRIKSGLDDFTSVALTALSSLSKVNQILRFPDWSSRGSLSDRARGFGDTDFLICSLMFVFKK